MTAERRKQQRRRTDVHPMEALNIAGRYLLDVGGTDKQIVDGQLVELTARVVTAEEMRESAEEGAMTEQEIGGFTKAIYDQCGMRATYSTSWSEFGMEVTVQVRLVPGDVEPAQDDWRFFDAAGEEELIRLRDELVDFIAQNRRAAA